MTHVLAFLAGLLTGAVLASLLWNALAAGGSVYYCEHGVAGGLVCEHCPLGLAVWAGADPGGGFG